MALLFAGAADGFCGVTPHVKSTVKKLLNPVCDRIEAKSFTRTGIPCSPCRIVVRFCAAIASVTLKPNLPNLANLLTSMHIRAKSAVWPTGSDNGV